MKTLIFGTMVALTIASISSAAYAKEPVPPAGTTGESANRRLEVIQQHRRNRQQSMVQAPNPSEPQAISNSMELRSTGEAARTACLLRPVTAGAMAQKAFAALQACQTGR